MPRINIYVPAELKSLMDRRSDIAWSSVAQDAFAKALGEPMCDWLHVASDQMSKPPQR